MGAPQLAELIVADHVADRLRQAGAARLAALARCCRPSAWRRMAGRATHRLSRTGAAPIRDEPPPCCA